MTLTHILIFAGASIPFMWLTPARWRPWGLLAGCVLAMGWFQSTATSLDLLLPAATIILIIAVWWLIQPPSIPNRDIWPALLIMGGGLAAIWVSLSERPGLMVMLSGVGVVSVAAISLSQLLPQAEQVEPYKRLAVILIAVIVVILVVLKSPPLARVVGMWSTADDALSRLSWLGFSYIAFRLIAVLLDFRAGNLPPDGFSLRDMAVYTLFFPAFTAGPIDRAQRFIPELDQAHPLDSSRLVEGAMRIAVGIGKKFILADSLALVAMNPALIDRTMSAPGLWLVLYLYTFQIFLDFSGYSDVAIGLGRLYGITLPENFDRPYLQPNIQQFWQRWHMTLSGWFRAYYFLPLSRALIRRHFSPTPIVFLAQISTMFLIGMWHGVTVNFALWGLWHGIGLFLFKLLADHTRGWTMRVNERPWLRRFIYAGSVFATFHFVALGWIFFALPTPDDSLNMLARLFGG
jgi:D-alanyl-lipoteichoic acid acyltransferase DltB (MBOAT superfamily)